MSLALTGEAAAGQGPTLDELKAALTDPERLNDPDGKAMRVAADVLREMREGGKPS
jgi:hypothetical protein